MKFSSAIAAILGASTVIALPQPQPNPLDNDVTLVPRTPRRSSRPHRRGQGFRSSNPKTASSGTTSSESHVDVVQNSGNVEGNATNIINTSYSSNWAGAVLVGSGYKYVTGTITVPKPTVPSSTSSSSRTGSHFSWGLSGSNTAASQTQYAASAWVGIDGDTCETAILQTGVDFYVQGTTVSFDAWYEWYPDYAYNFENIEIEAGDSITMTVIANSSSAGIAEIINNTKGTRVTHTFKSSETQGKLCETNAEWIVEDFQSGSSLVPFADFGSVQFTGCYPTVEDASIINIKQSNTVLTSCSTSGDDTVKCSYLG